MDAPLVTVICLCHNHERFVVEALESVVSQTYPQVEIIVVDDASTDGSVALISDFVSRNPALRFFPLPENVGNCRAFNFGFRMARGEFVVDFSTDDILMPDRLARQVQLFASKGQETGVVFTDATYIDEDGKFMRHHFEYLLEKGLIDRIPEGDVYQAVLKRYFICSPTMMVRKSVLDALRGYDETLSYEDFDFWVRSSRYYQYALLNERLTQVRKLSSSMSTGWYRPGDAQLHSTYLVCLKAKQLNQSTADRQALVVRVRFEFRQSVFSENFQEAKLFYSLLGDLHGIRPVDWLYWIVMKLNLPLSSLRDTYHRWRYQP